MDVRSEVRDFLTSRRGRITPEDAGLKVFGPRRVPGLRREEVAMLAGLSVDYYKPSLQWMLDSMTYTAEPGSRSAETFALLASWAAAEEATNPSRADPAARHRVERETK